MPKTQLFSIKHIGEPDEPFFVSKECWKQKELIVFIFPEDIALCAGCGRGNARHGCGTEAKGQDHLRCQKRQDCRKKEENQEGGSCAQCQLAAQPARRLAEENQAVGGTAQSDAQGRKETAEQPCHNQCTD